MMNISRIQEAYIKSKNITDTLKKIIEITWFFPHMYKELVEDNNYISEVINELAADKLDDYGDEYDCGDEYDIWKLYLAELKEEDGLSTL